MARSYRSRTGRKNRNRIYGLIFVIVIAGLSVYLFKTIGNGTVEPVNGSIVSESGIEDNTIEVAENSGSVDEPVNEIPIEPAVLSSISQPSAAEVNDQANPEVEKVLTEVKMLVEQSSNNTVSARDKLNEALRMPMSLEQQTTVKTQLAELSKVWLYGSSVSPTDELCEYYLVKSGDQFRKIGEQYKVPWELLAEINGISDPQRLMAGKKIKVVNGPFRAIVYRNTFTMDVYLQNTFVCSYKIGLGLPGSETPTGTWQVHSDPDKGKLEKPQWYDEYENKVYYPDDPNYPLGSRWIGLEGLSGNAEGREGFAIHGTKDEDQIGRTGSRGCIRMYNGDVIDVFNMLVPVDSRVEVTD